MNRATGKESSFWEVTALQEQSEDKGQEGRKCDRHGVHVPSAQQPKEKHEGECVLGSQTRKMPVINKSI